MALPIIQLFWVALISGLLLLITLAGLWIITSLVTRMALTVKTASA